MIQPGGGSIERFVSSNAVINGQTARVRFGGADITWDGTNLQVVNDTLTDKFTQTFTDPKINTSTGGFFGKIALAEEIRDGVKVSQTYQDGKLQGVDFLRDNETLLKIRPFDEHKPLSFANDGNLVNGEVEFGFEFKEVDVPEWFLRANQVAGPPPTQSQGNKNSLSNFLQSLSETFNKEGEGYKNFTKQLPQTIDIGKVDKNFTDLAGSAKIGAKLFEAGFEQKDENVGVRGYTVNKKAVLDFLGVEASGKIDIKKYQLLDLGGKLYVVKVGIEGEHVFGTIVGIKSKVEGTLGSFGGEIAIGKKMKIGVHKGIGASWTVEFFDPNEEKTKDETG